MAVISLLTATATPPFNHSASPSPRIGGLCVVDGVAYLAMAHGAGSTGGGMASSGGTTIYATTDLRTLKPLPSTAFDDVAVVDLVAGGPGGKTLYAAGKQFANPPHSTSSASSGSGSSGGSASSGGSSGSSGLPGLGGSGSSGQGKRSSTRSAAGTSSSSSSSSSYSPYRNNPNNGVLLYSTDLGQTWTSVTGSPSEGCALPMRYTTSYTGSLVYPPN